MHECLGWCVVGGVFGDILCMCVCHRCLGMCLGDVFISVCLGVCVYMCVCVVCVLDVVYVCVCVEYKLLGHLFIRHIPGAILYP